MNLMRAVPFVPELLDLGGQGIEPGLSPLDLVSAGEPRWGTHTGIKALMLAVLQEGIRNYLGSRPRLRSEAACWIASVSRSSPFAFCTVCETLGLEPGAVRIALQRLRETNVSAHEAVGRSRPNVRHLGPMLGRSAGSRRAR